MKIIIVILALFIISCSTPDLKGQGADCREIITCSKTGCVKHYKGADCSLDEKAYQQRKEFHIR